MKRLIVAAALLFAPAAEAADGEALYRLRCGMCHQARGYGTNVLARRAPEPLLERRADLHPQYVAAVVRRGLGGMPPFTRVELPDPDLAAIARYLARPTAERAP